tara:strand:+ start:403 stop:573 length:171 start_codon:yes stop_codon:yes gene_type:complete
VAEEVKILILLVLGELVVAVREVHNYLMEVMEQLIQEAAEAAEDTQQFLQELVVKD